MFYRLYNNDYTFYARVNEIDKDTLEIRVGSKDFPQCVLIIVDTKAAVAELQDALYNSKCASTLREMNNGTLSHRLSTIGSTHGKYNTYLNT